MELSLVILWNTKEQREVSYNLLNPNSIVIIISYCMIEVYSSRRYENAMSIE